MPVQLFLSVIAGDVVRLIHGHRLPLTKFKNLCESFFGRVWLVGSVAGGRSLPFRIFYIEYHFLCAKHVNRPLQRWNCFEKSALWSFLTAARHNTLLLRQILLPSAAKARDGVHLAFAKVVSLLCQRLEVMTFSHRVEYRAIYQHSKHISCVWVLYLK